MGGVPPPPLRRYVLLSMAIIISVFVIHVLFVRCSHTSISSSLLFNIIIMQNNMKGTKGKNSKSSSKNAAEEDLTEIQKELKEATMWVTMKRTLRVPTTDDLAFLHYEGKIPKDGWLGSPLTAYIKRRRKGGEVYEDVMLDFRIKEFPRKKFEGLWTDLMDCGVIRENYDFLKSSGTMIPRPADYSNSTGLSSGDDESGEEEEEDKTRKDNRELLASSSSSSSSSSSVVAERIKANRARSQAEAKAAKKMKLSGIEKEHEKTVEEKKEKSVQKAEEKKNFSQQHPLVFPASCPLIFPSSDYKSKKWTLLQLPSNPNDPAYQNKKNQAKCYPCELAGKDYWVKTSSGGFMINHLKDKHAELWQQDVASPITLHIPKQKAGNRGSVEKYYLDDPSKSNAEMKVVYDRSFVEYCMESGSPPNVVEGHAMQHLAAKLIPSCREYNLLNRHQVTKMAKEELLPGTRAAIEKKVDELDYVALTSDGWSARNLDSFLGCSVHGMDRNFRCFSATLEMIPLKSKRHKKDVIGKEVDNVIERVGCERCVAVVTDSASNASSFHATNIKCGCHVCNLVVGNAIGNCLTKAQVLIKAELFKGCLNEDDAEYEAEYNVAVDEAGEDAQQQNKKVTKKDSYVKAIFPILNAIRKVRLLVSAFRSSTVLKNKLITAQRKITTRTG